MEVPFSPLTSTGSFTTGYWITLSYTVWPHWVYFEELCTAKACFVLRDKTLSEQPRAGMMILHMDDACYGGEGSSWKYTMIPTGSSLDEATRIVSSEVPSGQRYQPQGALPFWSRSMVTLSQPSLWSSKCSLATSSCYPLSRHNTTVKDKLTTYNCWAYS